MALQSSGGNLDTANYSRVNMFERESGSIKNQFFSVQLHLNFALSV